MEYLSRFQFDVIFLNGQKVRVSANEIIEMLFHRYAIGFYLVMIFLIIALRPHEQANALPPTLHVLVYFGIYIFSFFNFAVFLIAFGWVANSLGRTGVSLTFALFASTLVNTWLGSIAIAAAGGDMIAPHEIVLQWLMNSLIFELALTGFALTLAPAMLRDLRGGNQAFGSTEIAHLMESHLPPSLSAPPPQSRGDQSWPTELEVAPGEIIRAEAQQNYVLIFTRGGRKLVRIPFQRFVSQMPEGMGLRVHRSRWVARAEIAECVSQDDKLFAQMKDGTRIPISKQYRLDILQDR